MAVAGASGFRPPVPVTLRPSQAATGSIQGTVLLSAALSARRPRFRIYTDAGPGAQPPDPVPVDTASEMANVILYVQSDSAHALAALGGGPPSRHPTVSQLGERFVPHVLGVVRGTTVDFPNEDDVFHNVFSLSRASVFDLGRYPKGQSRSVTFDRVGTVQVFCHIHSDMSAIVLVLDNRFFASPDRAGHFAIDGLPPGDYTVVGWHERIKPVERAVHVTAGGTSTVDFNIPLPAPGASGH